MRILMEFKQQRCLKKFLYPIVISIFSLFLYTSAFSHLNIVKAADYGFVGLQIQPLELSLTKALGLDQRRGVFVLDVAPGGPADISGVRRGDMIVKFDGADILGLQHAVGLVRGVRPAQQITLDIIRRGESVTLPVMANEWPRGWLVEVTSVAKYPALGLQVSSLSSEARDKLNTRWGATGLFVMSVDENSPAEKAGINPGEIIYAVGEKQPIQPSELEAEIKAQLSADDGTVYLMTQNAIGFRLLQFSLDGEGAKEIPTTEHPFGVFTAELPDGAGITVLDVRMGSDAAHAGLRRGDVIDLVDDAPATLAALKEADKNFKLQIKRHDGKLSIEVERGKGSIIPDVTKQQKALDWLGMDIANRTAEVERAYHLRWDVPGVAIVNVDKEGLAASARLFKADTIVSVNQMAVHNVSDLESALNKLKVEGNSHAMLLVENIYGYRLTALPLDEAAVGQNGASGSGLAPLLQLN